MIVAKQVIKWPDGPVDQIVAKWFELKGIDFKNVREYTIKRDASGSCWITVEMWFDPTETGLDAF